MTRIAYEIRVEGDLPDRLLEDFDSLTIVADPTGTVMRAFLSDEAELHGILDALRRGGVVLVDVRREQESAPADDPRPTLRSRGRRPVTWSGPVPPPSARSGAAPARAAWSRWRSPARPGSHSPSPSMSNRALSRAVTSSSTLFTTSANDPSVTTDKRQRDVLQHRTQHRVDEPEQEGDTQVRQEASRDVKTRNQRGGGPHRCGHDQPVDEDAYDREEVAGVEATRVTVRRRLEVLRGIPQPEPRLELPDPPPLRDIELGPEGGARHHDAGGDQQPADDGDRDAEQPELIGVLARPGAACRSWLPHPGSRCRPKPRPRPPPGGASAPAGSGAGTGWTSRGPPRSPR